MRKKERTRHDWVSAWILLDPLDGGSESGLCLQGLHFLTIICRNIISRLGHINYMQR